MSGQRRAMPDASATGFVLKPALDSRFVIGKIETTTGSCMLTRSGDSPVQIGLGDLVCKGDIIETASGGKVGIRFIDGSVFNLSDSARMVLQEFVADAASPSALFDISNGTFAFIAGEMAKTGRLSIDTPFARIRGRAGAGGIGMLSLASLFFAAMEQSRAGDSEVSFLDDGHINFKDLAGDYGVVQLDLKTFPPRTILVDDPGETIVLRPIGSSISESHVTNSLSQMLQYQNDQQEVLRTFVAGQGPAGFGNGGSGTPPPEAPTFQKAALELQPPPPFIPPPPSNGGTGGSTSAALDFVPPPPPPPPPGPTAGGTVELLNTTGDSMADTAVGSLAFSGVDPGTPTFVWSGGPLTATQQATLLAAPPQLKFTGADLTTFNFSIPDNALDFLAKNETLTVTYNATVTDNLGHNFTQQVVVTLTGSNDLPVITTATSNAFPELPGTNNAAPDSVVGTISFTDVDLSDGPTVTAPFDHYGYLAADGVTALTLTAPQQSALETALAIAPADDNTDNGSASWTYSVADNALDFLAKGEKLTLTYMATVDDHNGGVVT
ncbi:MAG TPA: VCBS domain-containing protein, partial [Pseudolabrys sp.]|nr:VCBS domain-containing protein [Pseudolabrys sp.]